MEEAPIEKSRQAIEHMQDISFWRIQTIYPVVLGFPGSSAGKESAYNTGDPGSIPGLRRSPGGGNDHPLQYSCLENPHGQNPHGLSTSTHTLLY